jgi:ribosomal protein S18 acetylase RimI-like enzyme
MTATIRAYRFADGDALRALWLEVGSRLIGDSDAGLDAFAARNPGLLLVATDEAGRVIGSALGSWDGRRGRLYHVATAPDRRRAGVARELVRRAEAGLRSLGCPRVLISVETSNTDALAFWEHLGYDVLDTLEMGKDLSSSSP